LRPSVDRLIVAGSLRRRKLEVGDVEVLFIPKFSRRVVDLFYETNVSLADETLERLLTAGIIQHRPNVNGSVIWGEKNKLAIHSASGIPVDFFTASEENWFNYLVCRTGSAASNTIIAGAAQFKGWKWNPYGPGFTDDRGQIQRVTSERDVFALAGLVYLEPWERNI
jgi:DNA polymerase/3'-5' exonuclease PolX